MIGSECCSSVCVCVCCNHKIQSIVYFIRLIYYVSIQWQKYNNVTSLFLIRRACESWLYVNNETESSVKPSKWWYWIGKCAKRRFGHIVECIVKGISSECTQPNQLQCLRIYDIDCTQLFLSHNFDSVSWHSVFDLPFKSTIFRLASIETMRFSWLWICARLVIKIHRHQFHSNDWKTLKNLINNIFFFVWHADKIFLFQIFPQLLTIAVKFHLNVFRSYIPLPISLPFIWIFWKKSIVKMHRPMKFESLNLNTSDTFSTITLINLFECDNWMKFRQ